ncbi:MAG: nuclease-related domain-containing protein, partial [Thermodesulfobacteriota bacterium]|nr:nuclease-related domain-containing protein [Thermodesulfobacteriota bacterium]
SYVMVSIMFIVMAGREWWVYYKDLPPSPKLLTFVAVVTVLYSAVKIRKVLKEVKLLRQGREGERAVGQYLESFREKGCKIFHDIVGENFNLDHVIVSDKGVFLIETKTYSKPEGKKPTILYDGDSLVIDGFNDRDKILNQARAASNWLKNLVHSTTGNTYTVKPVVVFPGWFIEPNQKANKSDVWVLNPKALPKYMDNQQSIIPSDEVNLIAYHLSRYVRAKEAEPKK